MVCMEAYSIAHKHVKLDDYMYMYNMYMYMYWYPLVLTQ